MKLDITANVNLHVHSFGDAAAPLTAIAASAERLATAAEALLNFFTHPPKPPVVGIEVSPGIPVPQS